MIYKQIPTFVGRTYRGGKKLREFLGMDAQADDFRPEDWITSFSEAKNRVYIPGEGVTRVQTPEGEKRITEVVKAEDFGEGRREPGVLIKFLDAAERLGIQVHPTRAYARKIFGVDYGKTESWYILDAREMQNEKACIYIGFREFVTKEVWKDLFDRQDIQGMLNAMHRFDVVPGDVILVTGGTPHAIGAGCFMVEVQEPSDYTMRVEKITVAGEALTPQQIHYGAGEEALLNCFEYLPLTREEAKNRYFLKHAAEENAQPLVTYEDTPYFAYERRQGSYSLRFSHYVTVIALSDGGTIADGKEEIALNRGDKLFVSADTGIELKTADVLICKPPKIG